MGMVVREDFKGWILRLSATTLGCSGYHENLEKCLLSGESYGYEFWIK